jgi:hypothetical protein
MTSRQILERLQDKPIDWRLVSMEQAFEVAAIGEDFVAECCKRDQESDKQAAREYQKEEFYAALSGR